MSKPAAKTRHSPTAAGDLRFLCVQLMRQLQTRGGSLTSLLPEAQGRLLPEDRAQLQAWVYGFSRFSYELQGIVDQLLDKPLKAKDLDVYLLMQLGVYQLRHTPTAAHAAVDETVKVVKRLKKPWARGLVNAVLRHYQRQQAELEAGLSESQRCNHPDWLLTRLKADWPESWQAICEQNNSQAPMTLRVSSCHGSVDQYRQRLTSKGLAATTVVDAEQALQLEVPVAVFQLPGFNEGHISVQDAAAQLSATYLQAHSKTGGRLLDACAAPGGKTAHALETGHFDSVLALDQDAERLASVSQNLDRLRLRAELKVADAAALDQWWDGEAFDAVLLDAPCSGTGVIRRHPDIKLLRRDSDIDTLVNTQASLLDALWKTVAADGLLLYVTCSVLKAENEHQLNAFLTRTAHADLIGSARQILPGEAGMDGFFYAAISKRSA